MYVGFHVPGGGYRRRGHHHRRHHHHHKGHHGAAGGKNGTKREGDSESNRPGKLLFNNPLYN